MGPNQGQGQLIDFAEQVLETPMFLDPCADIRNQVQGDVNGATFAAFFEGDMLRGMFATALHAVAGRDAAGALELDQAGGQNRLGAAQLLEAAVQLAANQRRVGWDAHTIVAGAETYEDVSENAGKWKVRRKKRRA
jgi:hypothetical protein